MQKIVTGASGLLGSEIIKCCADSIPVGRHVDLRQRNGESLQSELEGHSNIDTVIHCAAKVGGVKANTAFVADFFDDNMRINMNVLDTCKSKKLKLVSVLSTCVYPDASFVTYPLTEHQLHVGPPHPSNFGYAYAKRMLDVQSRAYRQQHDCKFITVIPNNLYGLNDNYDLESGHVIPALIRKFHEANIRRENTVTVWGSGSPLREFTFARDAAKIILWVAENYDGFEPVNIGNTEQISIRDLAQMIAEIFEFKGSIIFDSSRPDGQFQKPSSNAKLRNLGWCGTYTPLHEGLTETIRHFQKVYPAVRGVTMTA